MTDCPSAGFLEPSFRECGALATNNAVKYVLFVCLPAVFLTVAGIWLLVAVRGQFLAAQRIVYGREVDRLARSVRPEKFPDEKRGVFHWSPQSGLIDSRNIVDSLCVALQSTNVVWRAEWRKAKPPKIGWMRLGGEVIAWRRLADDSVVGGVIEPFADSDAGQRLPLFAVGFVLVALLAVVIFAGGYGLWRGLERERQENAEKTSFLANATHELKTPLAAIRLWSEMLSGGRLKPDRAQHAADVIVEENSRMIRLVENLLDFSRLEQNRRRYREEDVDVRRIVEGVVDLLRSDFARNGITVTGEDSLPAHVDGDALRQILVNLLGNAAKYAASGGPVEVEVAARGGRARISVSDRGPGMTSSERSRAFERFFRGAAAVESAGGGLGLGLAISHGLAVGMGGDLTLSPREGGGLVFTLEIPTHT